jgi:uncharacterized peroxidase-related enzyme
MSWIAVIPPEQSQGELRQVYTRLQGKRGKVANILQVHSLRPHALDRHVDLYMDIMFAPGGLSRRQREMIAVAVSQANGCAYCVAHHLEALRTHEKNEDACRQLAVGHTPAGWPQPDLALLEYARRLTREPSAASERDVATLRESGFADADILLANLVVAYFNFVNRIALGLGVAFNEAEVAGYTG